MPTYTCFAQQGVISDEQKHRLAAGIAKVHSLATGAPIGFTQCVFEDLQPQTHYIGGVPAPEQGVWVYGHIRRGRTPEAKGRILQGICELLVDVLDAPKEAVWVYINELDNTDMIEFGRVLPVEGEEWPWVDKLPADLRDHMLALQKSLDQ